MTKFLLLLPLLFSCASATPRTPASKAIHVACTKNADCSSQVCDEGICAPHQECHGPDDCLSGEACWTKVGCIPARCATSKDCYQGASCRSDGWCSYGE